MLWWYFWKPVSTISNDNVIFVKMTQRLRLKVKLLLLLLSEAHLQRPEVLPSFRGNCRTQCRHMSTSVCTHVRLERSGMTNRGPVWGTGHTPAWTWAWYIRKACSELGSSWETSLRLHPWKQRQDLGRTISGACLPPLPLLRPLSLGYRTPIDSPTEAHLQMCFRDLWIWPSTKTEAPSMSARRHAPLS